MHEKRKNHTDNRQTYEWKDKWETGGPTDQQTVRRMAGWTSRQFDILAERLLMDRLADIYTDKRTNTQIGKQQTGRQKDR